MKKTTEPREGLPTDPVLALRARDLLAQSKALLAKQQVAAAAKLSVELVRIAPNLAEAHRQMGILAMRTGTLNIALGSFRRAYGLKPRAADNIISLGDALIAAGEAAEAAEILDRGRKLHPDNAGIYRTLGQAQLELGQREAALKSFTRATKVKGSDGYSAHMVAALTDGGAANNSYVSELFDSYAGHFEQHLTGKLEYRVPEVLTELLAQHGPISGPTLDIGCGTGLMAAALPESARPIDGIDLAPNMVAKAAERGIYRNLRAGDATATLTSDPALSGPYGLITATDVFVYIGDFSALLAHATERLTPGGLIAFSVESHDGSGIAIRSSGRFAHASDYIHQVAAANGLEILVEQAHSIRLDREIPIAGSLVLLRKN